MTEVERARHEAGVMRDFVPILAGLRARSWGCVLVGHGLLGCGGLAEDGPRSTSDPDPNAVRAAEELARRSTEPEPLPPEQPPPEPPPPEPPPPEQTGEPPAMDTGVGAACSPPPEAGHGMIVGPVELRRDEQCGAGNWCLLRAPPEGECTGSLQGSAASCASEPAIPVPPPRLAVATWQEDTCTCRCDGDDEGLDYCACPQGMRCAPLIPSAGVNAAAQPLVGDYCVY